MGGAVSMCSPSAPAAAEQARRVGKVTPETSESVVLKLSENQLEEFRECFNAFDKDGGGSIDSHELQALMRSLGQDPTKEELAKMVALADADGSGDIDFCEFVTLIAHKMKSEQEGGKNTDRLMKAFSVFVRAAGNQPASARQWRRVVRPRASVCLSSRPTCKFHPRPSCAARRTWTVRASSICTRCGA
jgi:calmodulin